MLHPHPEEPPQQRLEGSSSGLRIRARADGLLLERHHALVLLAESFDAEAHGVAGFQVLLRDSCPCRRRAACRW